SPPRGGSYGRRATWEPVRRAVASWRFQLFEPSAGLTLAQPRARQTRQHLGKIRKLAHDFVHPVQCFFSLAPSAQDHKVIRISDEASTKALPQSELFPSQYEPAHVEIRQQR